MMIIIPHTIDYATVTSSVPETDTPAWVADSTYSKGATARVNYELFTSLVDNNKGNNPPASTAGLTAPWRKSGTSNRGAMFDPFVYTQTVAAGDSLEISVPWNMAAGFAVFNISGAVAMSVAIADAAGAVVAAKDYNLLQGVDNWYDYYTARFSFIRDIVDMTIGGFLVGTCTVTLRGDRPAIGHIVVGEVEDPGVTMDGVTSELVHYSTIETDDLGVTAIVERAATKKISCTLTMPKVRSDAVFELFEKLRARPCVWMGDNVPVDAGGQQFLTAFGLWRKASLSDKGTSQCKYDLEIMGLI